jgi:phytoene dehydrogenase-like protein
MSKTYDAIVVGGGLAGLTAATYLSRAGRSVLMCEQAEKCGGLVNTFERDGFFYDGGIRALEDSGVLFPMLRQLGIQLDFVPNVISIGLEDRVIRLESDAGVAAYQDLLAHFYPESRAEIEQIMQQIRTTMHYMDVLYGIENPMFLDFQANKEYMLREVLPWMVKYAIT